jgi:hypothetical protein
MGLKAPTVEKYRGHAAQAPLEKIMRQTVKIERPVVPFAAKMANSLAQPKIDQTDLGRQKKSPEIAK